MAMRDGRARQAGSRNRAAREAARTPLGAVRRAQMISTYGVGSMVAIGDRSYVVSGLDSWKIDQGSTIHEPRLQHWLNVFRFQLPPAASPPSGDGVRVRLFPQMYSCSSCNDLKEFHRFGSPRGRSECGICVRQLIPSRFVIACENGHLDDFPYFEWVHKKTSPRGESEDGHHLSLHSTGRTASLRSVVVKCSCGKSASLEGAFGRQALAALGIPCRGRRPWLGRDADQSGCTAVPRTLQRGSSAAWFPVNRSALSIPPWSQSLQQMINKRWTELHGLLEDGIDLEILGNHIKRSGMLEGTPFTVEEARRAVERRRELANGEGPDSDETLDFEPAGELRREEYEQLRSEVVPVDRREEFECTPPPVDPAQPKIREAGIDLVRQVKRLREVRALQSFTRVQMPDLLDRGERFAAMSEMSVSWLPAVEVSGEGVFFTLDGARLAEWEARSGPADRGRRIRADHTTALRRRAMTNHGPAEVSAISSPISARYILLHTLAHALINEWSLDSGYPAAALRERLYVAGDMAGVLIYTATSDSAGSLGGVVAQGEYARLRAGLESALARVSWCSQDPPCMESEASGTDSLNLAACYACVLLPETSCETNNVFLDRAMLIGTPEDPATGYFFSGA